MALMSQLGSSHCIHTETIQCKARHGGVNSISHARGTARTKEIFFGLCPHSWSSLKAIQGWTLDGIVVGQKQGHQMTVAASPPAENAAIVTELLTKEDLDRD